jgi:hypothetical protein
MARQQILICKISLTATTQHCKNGLFSVWYGLLEELLMKPEEKLLIL